MIKQDNSGKLFELHVFNSGLNVWKYSEDLHKINFTCRLYGLNPDKRSDFERAEKIINEKIKQ